MLTDHELNNYLNELGVLDEDKSKESSSHNRELFDELASQILANKELPPTQKKIPLAPVAKQKSFYFRPVILVIAIAFLCGLASGFFLGSLHIKVELQRVTELLRERV